MEEAIQTLLAADATLAALLTGGIYAADEISREDTPAAFDATTLEILPCANVKESTETPIGPHDHSSQAFIHIYFYQRAGTDTIRQAQQRTYELLHRKHLAGIGYVRHADDTRSIHDQALNASLAMSRYSVIRSRV